MNLKFLFILILPINAVAADVCQNWFEKTGIKKEEKNCFVECTLKDTDENTFHCTGSCSVLCDTPMMYESLSHASSYTSLILTDAERALFSQYPIRMIQAYNLSVKSRDELCAKIFRIVDRNDASDACRHFVWAALLYKRFGFTFSKQVLDAHEQFPGQPQKEKGMDLANNLLGLKVAEQLKQSNKLNETGIMEAFKMNLSQGNLVILK